MRREAAVPGAAGAVRVPPDRRPATSCGRCSSASRSGATAGRSQRRRDAVDAHLRRRARARAHVRGVRRRGHRARPEGGAPHDRLDLGGLSGCASRSQSPSACLRRLSQGRRRRARLQRARRRSSRRPCRRRTSRHPSPRRGGGSRLSPSGATTPGSRSSPDEVLVQLRRGALGSGLLEAAGSERRPAARDPREDPEAAVHAQRDGRVRVADGVPSAPDARRLGRARASRRPDAEGGGRDAQGRQRLLRVPHRDHEAPGAGSSSSPGTRPTLGRFLCPRSSVDRAAVS